MAESRRILGVDVGLKRVGIARSDMSGILASPLGTYSYNDALNAIADCCQTGEVRLIVVGWPLTLRGEEGDSVAMVRKFMKQLEKKVPGIPLKTLDERFTSSLARQSIRDSGSRKKKRRDKSLVDATAATILLQNYLDAQ